MVSRSYNDHEHARKRVDVSDIHESNTSIHRTLNTGMTRGGFLRGAGLAAGAVAAAGLGLGNVARAVYGEPPYADYVIHHPEEQRVWVYPLDWAGEYGPSGRTEEGASYDWYLPGTITGYVLNGPDDPLPDKDNLDIPVVSGNAPNPPAFPIVEMDEGAFIIPCDPYYPECEEEIQEYIFFYQPPEEEEPWVEWIGTAQSLYKIVKELELSNYNDYLYLEAPWEGGSPVGLSPEHQGVYNEYEAIAERLEDIREEWQSKMDYLWLKYYQWDVKHVQYAIDNWDNVILKSTNPLGNPMYFYFGQGGLGSIGHVEITGDVNVGRHVTISGEPGDIPLPNNVTMPGGKANRSTIYGGGTEIEAELPMTGAISMQLENPYGPSDQYGNPTPTGFNLTVDNVHLDHFQIIGINVEASREMVEIKNCVFSNPVQGLNWWIAQAMGAHNTPRWLSGKDDNGNWILLRFLNGEIVVKDCLFGLENSRVEYTIAIMAWDSETLTKFTATGNTIHAFNELSWLSTGISCRALTKINPNNNPTVDIYDNPLIQGALSGIDISPHFAGSPGYAKITGNTVEVKGNWFEGYWSGGISVNSSDAGALIFNNDITLNGWAGSGISLWESSNCTVRKNTIKTGEPIWPLQQPLCKFGISADGESREERITSNNHIGGESAGEDGNILDGNFEFGVIFRDTDGCIFENNDFSKAKCYNVWPAIDPFFDNPSIILGAQIVVGPGTTNGVFRNNKFGQVYTVYGMDWEAGLDMSAGELRGPTVNIGQSWFHYFFEGYDNQNPLSDNHFSGNNYAGTGLPGWSAEWGSSGAIELTGIGCILAGFNSKKIIFDELLFPLGTTACNQILDLGSANRIYDEQNKNLKCNKILDTTLFRQYFNENRADPGKVLEKHFIRAYEYGKGLPGLYRGIRPHWKK